MSAPGPAHSVDILRKGLIVAALVGGVVLLHQFVAPGELDHRGLMALGFVVLAAYTIGELAEVFKLPHITGYLLAGLLLGPSAAHELAHFLPGVLPAPFDHGILSEGVIGQLSLLDTLALPLIALTAGGELHIHELKSGLRPIMGVLLGQAITLVLAFMVFAVIIGGAIPGVGLPEMSALDLSGQLLIGTVLGALGLATSAAATIAIILGVGAKGPMTRTVLSVVVLKDVAVVVLFAATTAAATAALGSGGDGGLSTAFLHIGLSVVLGVVLGGIVHAYLRFIGVERLLFLVALIYTTAFLCDVLHAEVALVFIAAGFVVANFSDQGEKLIHDVERLSLPVFVVFFTLAGARLHIDVILQMAGYAALLVTVRAAATWAGVRIGGQLSGADPNTRRYGWMGMIAQAGLAISLAGQLPGLFPGGLGQELYALVLAGVAVHEVIGPAMLQMALVKAKETPQSEASDDGGTPDVRAETDIPAPDTSDPWGPPYLGPTPSITTTIVELETDLRALTEDVHEAQVKPWSQEGQAWVGTLRRAFLRAHRKATDLARDPELQSEPMVRLVEELEMAWRSAVWSRAGGDVLDGLAPTTWIARLDQRLDGLPGTVSLPVNAETLTPREESAGKRLLRFFYRTAHQLSKAPRDTPVRDLWRYHVGGTAVGRMSGVVAPLVRTELDTARSLGVLFSEIARGWPMAGGPENTQALASLRPRVLDALETLSEQFQHAEDDARKRIAAIVGGGMAQAKADLPLLGSIDLPHHLRRFSRVYNNRNRSVTALTTGLDEVRQMVAARHRAAGVEMEVATLQVAAGAAIRSRATSVGRLIAELGVRPVRDAETRVEAFLHGVRVWDAPQSQGSDTGDALARELRERATPVLHAIEESTRLLSRLSDALHASCAEHVEQTVHHQVSRLTERITVPARSIPVGDWDLPRPVTVVDLSLREGVRAWLDARVGAALEAAAEDAHGIVNVAKQAATELNRVVSFNIDLAANELEVFGSGPPTVETRALVSEMLQGAIHRSHQRARPAWEALMELQLGLPETIAETVPSIIGELSADLVRGDLSALRRIASDEALFTRDLRQGLIRSAEAIQLPAEDHIRAIRLAARRLLGQERWSALTAETDRGAPDRDGPISVIPTHPDLPVVYRRLFSDQVVSSVTLSADKAVQVRRAAAVLDEHRPGRAVVIVSDDPALRALLVDEMLRAIDLPPESISPHQLSERALRGTAPAIVHDLGAWLELTPRGLETLQALTETILSSPRPWVILSAPETWRRAERHTDLGAVAGAVVAPGPLDIDELERALMGRHAMSGMKVEFDVDALVGLRVSRLLQATEQRSRSNQKLWFRHLHHNSRGRLSDAMRLWMAAVTEVDDDDGTIVIGPIPRGLPPHLDHLSDADLLLLRRTLATAGDSPDALATVTQESLVSARGRFLRLAGRGLLVEADGTFRIPDPLRGPVRDQIRARGWEVTA